MYVFSSLFLSPSLRPHPWFASAVFLCWSALRDRSLCSGFALVHSLHPRGPFSTRECNVWGLSSFWPGNAWQYMLSHVAEWSFGHGRAFWAHSVRYRWHEHKQLNFVLFHSVLPKVPLPVPSGSKVSSLAVGGGGGTRTPGVRGPTPNIGAFCGNLIC